MLDGIFVNWSLLFLVFLPKNYKKQFNRVQIIVSFNALRYFCQIKSIYLRCDTGHIKEMLHFPYHYPHPLIYILRLI